MKFCGSLPDRLYFYFPLVGKFQGSYRDQLVDICNCWFDCQFGCPVDGKLSNLESSYRKSSESLKNRVRESFTGGFFIGKKIRHKCKIFVQIKMVSYYLNCCLLLFCLFGMKVVPLFTNW